MLGLKIMQIIRLIKIYYILGKYNLIELLPSNIFSYALKLFSNLVFRFNSNTKLPRAVRYRRACEDLGPIFIKIGQLLSTRKDLLPADIALELEKLQDNVPAFCGKLARATLEKIYGQQLYEHLKDFDETPLASASVAQVHAATLIDGRQVVVKILRPDIEKYITKDLQLIKSFTKLIVACGHFKQFKPLAVIHELEKSLFDELDLQKEAANASQLRRNFDNSSLLYIPYIYWPLTSKQALVQEKLNGIPISNIAMLKAHNISLKRLAEVGVEIFFTQVFRDCFFHADMHPGNIWVCPKNPSQPQYIGLDFGIVGTLDSNNQYYLAENFLAFFNHDYKKVAELHINSGWVPADTRVDEFEAAIRTVCEPIFCKPLHEISFGKTLLNLFQTARKFNMEIQPQLILLQKTLVSVEGLGRQLYPELDLWKTAKPYLQQWMKKKIGPLSILKELRKNAPYWLDKMPEIPHLIYKKLKDDAHRGEQLNQLQQIISRQQDKSLYTSSKVIYFLAGAMVTLVTMAASKFVL
jgi:ubiquinone biosynthesis protein